ncbi:hypothetical protein AGABI2DRAFT_194301 [Agaricus bisporus var. bisporus H97]|uniref:hypothetical protein n=1 Tax=Agaricus bisporus var. bisporus (strain H97 / ATCC MYA-4626 / FGSC 10389) TaxID=936046 RepID=UPI00029F55DF|nr:hypothetical protein AGABI2DRAFT_194301 [Agaricus bisporus var. bisporus H97]EKV45348.1 hypothetical protein AGABI2DRAFT_194301 [Agaricus bisporus var. bisporus H97]
MGSSNMINALRGPSRISFGSDPQAFRHQLCIQTLEQVHFGRFSKTSVRSRSGVKDPDPTPDGAGSIKDEIIGNTPCISRKSGFPIGMYAGAVIEISVVGRSVNGLWREMEAPSFECGGRAGRFSVMVSSDLVDVFGGGIRGLGSGLTDDFGRESLGCCFPDVVGFGGRGMPIGGIGVDDAASPFMDIDIAQSIGSKSMFMTGNGSCIIDTN